MTLIQWDKRWKLLSDDLIPLAIEYIEAILDKWYGLPSEIQRTIEIKIDAEETLARRKMAYPIILEAFVELSLEEAEAEE